MFKMETAKAMQILRTLLFLIVSLTIFNSCQEDEPFSGNSGTFKDKRDGRVYKWVRIGDQIWMAENLAYIPYVCPADSQCGIWVNGYQDTKIGRALATANYQAYGCLYDWETAMVSCPKGWHLPSDEEWMELELFLGMTPGELDEETWRGYINNVDGKLKETGTIHWDSPNSNATNESGFTARPGGKRYYHESPPSSFSMTGGSGSFWTATEEGNYAFGRGLSENAYGVYRHLQNKKDGLSIRCIKD